MGQMSFIGTFPVCHIFLWFRASFVILVYVKRSPILQKCFVDCKKNWSQHFAIGPVAAPKQWIESHNYLLLPILSPTRSPSTNQRGLWGGDLRTEARAGSGPLPVGDGCAAWLQWGAAVGHCHWQWSLATATGSGSGGGSSGGSGSDRCQDNSIRVSSLPPLPRFSELAFSTSRCVYGCSLGDVKDAHGVIRSNPRRHVAVAGPAGGHGRPWSLAQVTSQLVVACREFRDNDATLCGYSVLSIFWPLCPPYCYSKFHYFHGRRARKYRNTDKNLTVISRHFWILIIP